MCLWILLLISWSLNIVETENVCSMKDFKITCRFMGREDLYSNITVILDAEDVLDLDIADSLITHVDRNIFGRYKNIHTLSLQNNNINNIDQNAFSDLPFLQSLKLRNNLLQNFSSNVFSTNNSLYNLDLSNNLLKELAGFNISHFPYLKIMNVSNNRLEYLPETLLNKLEETNNFHIISDNNPWNCSHPGWTLPLKPTLIAAFCTGTIFDSSSILKKLSYLENRDSFAREYTISNRSASYEIKSNKCAGKNWCFSYCVFWFIAALWMGIILGNVCKLKEILCRTSPKMGDKCTQYDMTDLRPKI